MIHAKRIFSLLLITFLFVGSSHAQAEEGEIESEYLKAKKLWKLKRDAVGRTFERHFKGEEEEDAIKKDYEEGKIETYGEYQQKLDEYKKRAEAEKHRRKEERERRKREEEEKARRRKEEERERRRRAVRFPPKEPVEPEEEPERRRPPKRRIEEEPEEEREPPGEPRRRRIEEEEEFREPPRREEIEPREEREFRERERQREEEEERRRREEEEERGRREEEKRRRREEDERRREEEMRRERGEEERREEERREEERREEERREEERREEERRREEEKRRQREEEERREREREIREPEERFPREEEYYDDRSLRGLRSPAQDEPKDPYGQFPKAKEFDVRVYTGKQFYDDFRKTEYASDREKMSPYAEMLRKVTSMSLTGDGARAMSTIKREMLQWARAKKPFRQDVGSSFANVLKAAHKNKTVRKRFSKRERRELNVAWLRYKPFKFSTDYKLAKKELPSKLAKIFKKRLKRDRVLRIISNFSAMVGKMTSANMKDRRARKFLDGLERLSGYVLQDTTRAFLELIRKTKSSLYFSSIMQRKRGKTKKKTIEVLTRLETLATTGFDFDKELKAVKKMAHGSIDKLSLKMDKFLALIKSINEKAGGKVTQSQAKKLYLRLLKSYKIVTKAIFKTEALSEAVERKESKTFRKISKFAEDIGRLIKASNVSLSKKREANRKRIEDSLYDGFHFEFYYKKMKTRLITKLLPISKLAKMIAAAKFMARKINTAEGRTKRKNTSPKQLKKYLNRCYKFELKIRGKLGKEGIEKIIFDYRDLLKRLVDNSTQPVFSAGIAEADKGLRKNTATKLVTKLKNLLERMGRTGTPFYLRLELRKIKKLKKDQVAEKIAEFRRIIPKIKIVLDDKKARSDYLKTIKAISKIDKIMNRANLENYERLLVIAKTLFDKAGLEKQRTYKKLVTLMKEYQAGVMEYVLYYRDLLKEKTHAGKMQKLKIILDKAPVEFFKKKKLLKSYRQRVKNQIVKLSKKKAVRTDQTLRRLLLAIIDIARRHEQFATKYKNTLKKAVLRLYKDDIKELKKAHSNRLVAADVIRRLAVRLGEKKAIRDRLLEKERQRVAAGKKGLGIFDRGKLKKAIKFVKITYPTKKREYEQKLQEARRAESRLQPKLRTAHELVREETSKILGRNQLKLSEKLKAKLKSK
jgi:hypothetical protein